MKNLLLLPIIIILLSACEENVKMGYDESQNDPILEAQIDKSPKENVMTFLSGADVEAVAIGIYSSPAKNCECAENGKDCYCGLSNEGLSGHSCTDTGKLCKKTKYIEVEIHPDDVEALQSIGFEKSNG